MLRNLLSVPGSRTECCLFSGSIFTDKNSELNGKKFFLHKPRKSSGLNLSLSQTWKVTTGGSFFSVSSSFQKCSFFLTTRHCSAGMYSSGKTNLQLKFPSPSNDLRAQTGKGMNVKSPITNHLLQVKQIQLDR